jgi:alpha-beta hydrolase superfamily lysophospholipase
MSQAAASLAFERFDSGGRQEWLMRIGADDAPAILFLPPLFEEMNRTRALIAATMRRLAAQGFGCWLPDLSGTGESERELGQVEWDDWRHDVIAASAYVTEKAGKPLVASLRGGILLDDDAAARGWWRFAPVEGLALQRDMVRAGLAGVEWAGYAPSEALKAGLAGATAAEVLPLRTVRLATDAQPADLKVDGPALWRRSEPGTSDLLADALAADLAEWSRTCAG